MLRAGWNIYIHEQLCATTGIYCKITRSTDKYWCKANEIQAYFDAPLFITSADLRNLLNARWKYDCFKYVDQTVEVRWPFTSCVGYHHSTSRVWSHRWFGWCNENEEGRRVGSRETDGRELFHIFFSLLCPERFLGEPPTTTGCPLKIMWRLFLW